MEPPDLSENEEGFLFISHKPRLTADETKLWRAAAYGDIETVAALLESGVDIHSGKDSPLRWAACAGETEMVRFLIQSGADIHTGRDAPLRGAVFEERTQTVAALLDAGAHIHELKDWDWENTDAKTLDLIKDRLRCSLEDELRTARRTPTPALRFQP